MLILDGLSPDSIFILVQNLSPECDSFGHICESPLLPEKLTAHHSHHSLNDPIDVVSPSVWVCNFIKVDQRTKCVVSCSTNHGFSSWSWLFGFHSGTKCSCGLAGCIKLGSLHRLLGITQTWKFSKRSSWHLVNFFGTSSPEFWMVDSWLTDWLTDWLQRTLVA